MTTVPLSGALIVNAFALLCPVMKVAPLEPPPPMLTVPVPKVVVVVALRKVPFLMVLPPLNKLFAPEIVSWPPVSLTSDPAPLMTPDRVCVVVDLWRRTAPLAMVMAPA